MERMLQGPIPRHSPCVGVCTLDPASGWCLGCGRNTDEIARWSTMDEAEQLDCWSKLPRRLATLSVQAHLLPWAVDHITKWVGTTLAAERGTWVTGVPGAVAEFPCGPEHNVEVVRDRDFVGGRTGKAVFRLNLHDKLRAFAFGQGAPIVLGIPKVRVPLAVAHTLTALGPDIGAVDIQSRSDQLFDFGLGRRSS